MAPSRSAYKWRAFAICGVNRRKSTAVVRITIVRRKGIGKKSRKLAIGRSHLASPISNTAELGKEYCR